ncbi:MAG: DUF2950 domain-containing protein [PVC group bacterium]|nr:DUF2950 domain-containing protein [PVC group bacterium]
MKTDEIMTNRAGTSIYSIFSIIIVILLIIGTLVAMQFLKRTYQEILPGSKSVSSGNVQIPAELLKGLSPGGEVPPEQEAPKTIVVRGSARTENKAAIQALTEYHNTESILKDSVDREKIIANEKSAAKLLKKYAAAQEIYRKYYGLYAENAAELLIEKKGVYEIIDDDLRILNSAKSKQRAMRGYYYIETVRITVGESDSKNSFMLCAVPAEYGRSGIHTLCINSQNQTMIFQKNNSARPIFHVKEINPTWEGFQP